MRPLPFLAAGFSLRGVAETFLARLPLSRAVTRLHRSLFALAAVLAVVGGGMAWRAGQQQRQWRELRPSLPAPLGATAPGLDARLAGLTPKFERWPPDRAALADFAQLCAANGLLAEAIQGFAALGVIDPANARWPHLQAELLTGFGRTDEALPLLEHAAVLAPNEPVLWLRLGEVRLKNNQAAAATEAFTRLLALAPGNVHALFGLARCDLQAGRLTAARARLQEACAADPAFPGAPSLLATVLERLGNPEAAEAARKRVSGDGHYTQMPDPLAVDLVAYGHQPYLLLVAASAEISDARYARALPLLERALTLAPDDPRLYRQLGRARAWLRDLPGARQAFERAVALAPGDEKMRSELISVLRQQQDRAALETVVAQGVALAPDSASLRFEAGRLAVQDGHPDEAIAHFRFVAQARPEESAAQCELAKVYFGLGRADEGITVLLGVLRDRPASEPALTLLVRYGLDHADPRTGDWLRAALAAGKPSPALAELRQSYQRQFGNLP
jgi:predicted Zn-dependent protease